jgi:hypothetical protein
MFEMTQSRSILSLGCHKKGEIHTEWDFEFWGQRDETFKSSLYRPQMDAVEMDKTWTGDMRICVRGGGLWKFDLLKSCKSLQSRVQEIRSILCYFPIEHPVL